MCGVETVDVADKACNQDSDVSTNDINTDGRNPFQWKSKYPSEARREMRNEAIYISSVFVFSLICLLLNWMNIFASILGLEIAQGESLQYILFYFISGLLGGVIFGVKYFYRVVARGYWSQDRIYWRIFSPWISATIAIVIGCMVSVGYIDSPSVPSDYMGICIGFFAGYFADEAVGKMYEVATVLFGHSTKSK